MMNQAAPLDIDELMRKGHPFLADTAQCIVDLVVTRARERAPARILEIGCASAMLTAMVRDRLPDAELVAQEELPSFLPLIERRLAGRRVELFARPFAEWERPVDVLYSGGAHHHLDQSYLAHARRLLRPGGVFVLGDEFCPEYCLGDDAGRIERAEVIARQSGYVLTTAAEVEAFATRAQLPAHALEREARRKQALWRWYRYVVDEAMAGAHIEVAASELQSAHDDLVTGSAAEHKMSPRIAERELALHGFRQLSKRLLGPSDRPELQSFFVYEFA